MAIIKCKMCGGDIELSADKTFGICEYCSSTMTFPKVDDEQRAAAFNRGNHFRRLGEFDNALAVYEQIVREDNTDAEAHWCCALCRFGIEYVEDPATYEYIPTCHRASFDSFLEDVDYLAALEYSDGATQRQYKKDAAKIAEVQRGILATSQNEEPFDVFICYKESDEKGQRTRDSLMAQDIYYQLTEQGYRVFFSRITLEDIVGKQYEPYIFAALHSAKIMIVVGTKAEHMNAVWVKNEWRRFLALMKKDRSKMLLPCYRDMDPYDMPSQLSVLQSYDMGKIGFIQDLTRGIRKVLTAERKPEPVREQVVVQQSGVNTAALLERAFLFLEDGDWASADEYCEKVLDQDPKNAYAYVGKLMAELEVEKQESLKDCAEPFDGSGNYQKAVRFADAALKMTLTGYIEHIHERNEQARLAEAYRVATVGMNNAESEQAFIQAAYLFEQLDAYEDAAQLALACREKAEQIRIEQARKAEEIRIAKAKHVEELRIEAAKRAEERRIESAKRAEERRIAEAKRAEEERLKAERNKKILKKFSLIFFPSLVVVIAFVIVLCTVILPAVNYNKAVTLMEAGQYQEAIMAFEAMNGYKDSTEKIEACRPACYDQAVALMEAGNRVEAVMCFSALGDYQDARMQADRLWAQITGRKTIAAGCMHMVSLKTDGTVVAAGWNSDGQCDVSGWTDIVAVAAGFYHTVGLKADGTVVAVGRKGHAQCRVSDWTDIVAVAAGSYYTVGLQADGTVVAVGSNSDGQCDVDDWTDIVAVAAGYEHTVGLKADGTVVAVGSNSDGQCEVSGWTDIVAVAAGDEHTVGLKADGTVVAVGSNVDGRCEVSGWTDIVAVAVGDEHTVGLKANGTVVTVGRDFHGQCDVDSWTDIVAVAAGDNHTVGLKADGTVVVVGSNSYGQCDVDGWKNIKVPE